MTEDADRQIKYITSSGQVDYDVPFTVFQDVEIELTLNGAALSESEYSFDASVPKITLASAPAASQDLVIRSVISGERSSEYTASTAFSSDAVNDDLRYLRAGLSDARRDLTRFGGPIVGGPILPLSSVADSFLLGNAKGTGFDSYNVGASSARASRVLAFDQAGNMTTVPLGQSDDAALLLMEPGIPVAAGGTRWALNNNWYTNDGATPPDPIDTDAGLIAAGFEKVIPDGVIYPEQYATLDAAWVAAGETGKLLKGRAGQTYEFTTGVDIVDPVSGAVRADFSMAFLKRGLGVADDAPAVRITSSFSDATYADAMDIFDLDYADVDYGGGNTQVTVFRVLDASTFFVGQIVKILSTDIVPNGADNNYPNRRRAESGKIGKIDGNLIYFYKALKLQEKLTTGLKVTKFGTTEVSLKGGVYFDAPGAPDTRHSEMIELIGIVEPVEENVVTLDTMGGGVFYRSCYKPKLYNPLAFSPRHKPTVDAFGYGRRVTSCQGAAVYELYAYRSRHGFTSGAPAIETADINTSSPALFGQTISPRVYNGDADESMNAPWSLHPDCEDGQFINCTVNETHRGPNGTFVGFLLRGFNGAVIGGSASCATPVRIEINASEDNIPKVIGLTCHRTAGMDDNRAYMIDIKGEHAQTDAGVAAQARAQVHGLILQADSGRTGVEVAGASGIVYANNTRVDWRGGSIDWAFDNTNAIVFDADNGASIEVSGVGFDFSRGTSNNPFLGRTFTTADYFKCSNSEVKGRAGTTIGLNDFNNLGGRADIIDVSVDQSVYLGNGWRDAVAASSTFARVSTNDFDASQPNVIRATFGSASTAMPITWPLGLGHDHIFVMVNATAAGTSVGSIPDGVRDGQLVTLQNAGASNSFVVNDTPSNIGVRGNRTVLAGANTVLEWNKANGEYR